MIPIKEKSQRVPGKTFQILKNKPLAYWIVDALLKSRYSDSMDIWINTDSNKVVDLYKDGGYDLNYYIRPENVRGHDVSMNRVLEDWIRNVDEYETYVQTHITNPFLSSQTIDDGIFYFGLSSKIYVSVMGATRHQCRMWYNKQPVNFNHSEIIPTQNLKPVYEDNSCLYVFNKRTFERYGRVMNPPEILEVNWPENIDIDTEDEFRLAELVANETT